MAWTRQIGHPFSELFALHMGIWLRQLRSEPEIVAGEARQLRTRAAELELPYLKAEGDLFLGWAPTHREPPGHEPMAGAPAVQSAGAAIRRLRGAMAEHETLGMRFGRAGSWRPATP